MIKHSFLFFFILLSQLQVHSSSSPSSSSTLRKTKLQKREQQHQLLPQRQVNSDNTDSILPKELQSQNYELDALISLVIHQLHQLHYPEDQSHKQPDNENNHKNQREWLSTHSFSSSCKRLFHSNYTISTWTTKPNLDFTHIPKTGGASLTIDLFEHNWWTVQSGSAEKCFEDHSIDHAMKIILLRQPKYHVYSQFAMCKYSAWGQKVTSTTATNNDSSSATATIKFPRSKNATDDYYQFLLHFTSLTEKDIGPKYDYHCHDPRNKMTRYLSCNQQIHQQSMIENGQNPEYHTMFPGPNMTQALSNLHLIDLLGITYFQDEFMCLFMFLEEGKIPSSCFCSNSSPSAASSSAGKGRRSSSSSSSSTSTKMTTTASHFNHGVEYLSEEILSSSILIDLVKKITNLDLIVYLHGLERFLCEMRILEERVYRDHHHDGSKSGSGNIMCEEKMKRFLQDSSYLFS